MSVNLSVEEKISEALVGEINAIATDSPTVSYQPVAVTREGKTD